MPFVSVWVASIKFIYNLFGGVEPSQGFFVVGCILIHLAFPFRKNEVQNRTFVLDSSIPVTIGHLIFCITMRSETGLAAGETKLGIQFSWMGSTCSGGSQFSGSFCSARFLGFAFFANLSRMTEFVESLKSLGLSPSKLSAILIFESDMISIIPINLFGNSVPSWNRMMKSI